MPEFFNKESNPFREKRFELRRLKKLKSLLCDWYGKKWGEPQITAYMSKSIHVKDAVKKILSDYCYQDGLLLEKLQNSWIRLVGTEVSNNSKPVSLKDGILTIEAKNSIWLSELKNFYSIKIEEKVRSICGSSVKKIYYTPGKR